MFLFRGSTLIESGSFSAYSSEEIRARKLLDNLPRSIISYYASKGDDFRKIPHVKAFVDWIEKNKGTLLRDLFNDLHTNQIRAQNGTNLTGQNLTHALGLWVGIRYSVYIASTLNQVTIKQILPPIIVSSIEFNGEYNAEWDSGNKRFCVADLRSLSQSARSQLSKLSTTALLMIAINVGLHEGTHALPFMCRGKNESLSEFATSVTAAEKALPILRSDTHNFFGIISGVRNFNRNIDFYNGPMELSMVRELQNLRIVGQIYTMSKKETNSSNVPHQENILHMC